MQTPDHKLTMPTPQDLLDAPDVSFWLKAALRTALERDPVDSAADAELLARVLGARADTTLTLVAMRQAVR